MVKCFICNDRCSKWCGDYECDDDCTEGERFTQCEKCEHWICEECKTEECEYCTSITEPKEYKQIMTKFKKLPKIWQNKLIEELS